MPAVKRRFSKARLFLLIVGLAMLFSPGSLSASPGHHAGQTLARAAGAFLAVLSVFPFGMPREE